MPCPFKYYVFDCDSLMSDQCFLTKTLTTHTSLSPIRSGFAPHFVNYKKGCTRLATPSDKFYQLLAHGRWFSLCTPASSTTKTGCHDIAKILLKVELNTINQSVNLTKTPCYYCFNNYLSTFTVLFYLITTNVFFYNITCGGLGNQQYPQFINNKHLYLLIGELLTCLKTCRIPLFYHHLCHKPRALPSLDANITEKQKKRVMK